MTDVPNIGRPRDTMAAQDCEFALELFLMNQPGWPPRPGGDHATIHGLRSVFFWPTEKSYRWMNDHPTS